MALITKIQENKGDRPFQIYGEKDVIRQLELLHNMGARTHNFRAAFTRAAKPMKENARARARVFARNTVRFETTKFTRKGVATKSKRTYGPIWKSISIMTSRRYRGVFWLGPTRGKTARFDAWYAYFQEAGTVRGIKGKYFMRGAYESYKWQTRKLITQELYNEMYKIAGQKFAP